MANPTLLLFIEERNRELLSRVLIAHEALNAGFDVVIGQQWELARRLDSLAPSAVLFKGNNAMQANWMSLAKQHGHFVCSIEEEVFGIRHAREIRRCYDPRIFDLCDLFFAHGKFEKDVLKSISSAFQDRIAVVGNPRADVARRLARHHIDNQVKAPQTADTPYVLFNGHYGSVLPRIDDVYGQFEKDVRVGMVDINHPSEVSWAREGYRWEKEGFEAFLALAIKCASLGIDVRIRPHPGEDSELWKRGTAGIYGITIIDSGDQLHWLEKSVLLVHTGCTTGLEAFLMSHPAMALIIGQNEWHDVTTSNIVNPVFTDIDQAAHAISSHVRGSKPINMDWKRAHERLHDYLALAPDENSASRIINSLLTKCGNLPPWPEGGLEVLKNADPEKVSGRRMKAVIEKSELETAFFTWAQDDANQPRPIVEDVGAHVFHVRAGGG